MSKYAIPQRSLLQRYVVELTVNPLRTKALTAAVLCGLQELTAQGLCNAQLKKKFRAPFDKRILKMALYGLLVSGPLGHYLYALWGRVVAGRAGPKWALLTLLVSNLVFSPIQNSVFLASMSVIRSGVSVKQMEGAVRMGLMGMQRTSWVMFPLVQASAIKFLPMNVWTPYFNLVAFFFGTFFNTKTKLASYPAEAKVDSDEKSA